MKLRIDYFPANALNIFEPFPHSHVNGLSSTLFISVDESKSAQSPVSMEAIFKKYSGKEDLVYLDRVVMLGSGVSWGEVGRKKGESEHIHTQIALSSKLSGGSFLVQVYDSEHEEQHLIKKFYNNKWEPSEVSGAGMEKKFKMCEYSKLLLRAIKTAEIKDLKSLYFDRIQTFWSKYLPSDFKLPVEFQKPILFEFHNCTPNGVEELQNERYIERFSSIEKSEIGNIR